MPTDAAAFYNVNVSPDRVGSARNGAVYYNSAIGPNRVYDLHRDGAVYYNLNQLEDFLHTPAWFNTFEGETIWNPGLIHNGTEFVRYKMYDGNMFRASYSESLEQPSVFPNASVSGTLESGANIGGGPYADTMTAPAFPAGTTTAVALVSSGYHSDLAIPNGWTRLGQAVGVGSGGGGTIHHISAVVIDNVVGDEDLSFVFSNVMPDTYHQMRITYAYFQNGGRGYWNVTNNHNIIGASLAYASDVGSDYGPHLWWQAGVITAVYTAFYGNPEGDISGSGNGFHEYFAHPAFGTSTGENFHARWLGGRPYPDGALVDTNNIGAYGQPNSSSWGFLWTPGERPV